MCAGVGTTSGLRPRRTRRVVAATVLVLAAVSTVFRPGADQSGAGDAFATGVAAGDGDYGGARPSRQRLEVLRVPLGTSALQRFEVPGSAGLAAAPPGRVALGAGKTPPEPEPERGSEYYAGMLSSPMTEADVGKDMLTPNLKLVIGSVVLSGSFILYFMASNGLL
mmetsp:Transcript_42713/g.117917  ORF Transcript_42713/g.117917 Transcript_42713/m.117917 type:complete len:166 (-) Transcript_42713:135-632(-)